MKIDFSSTILSRKIFYNISDITVFCFEIISKFFPDIHIYYKRSSAKYNVIYLLYKAGIAKMFRADNNIVVYFILKDNPLPNPFKPFMDSWRFSIWFVSFFE